MGESNKGAQVLVIRSSANCKKDFKDLIDYLASKEIISEKFQKKYKDLLRKNHQFIYAIALFLHKLQKKHENRYIYLQEILSDFIQIIPLILLGYWIPCRFLLRRIVENTLNHIYYYHHPIEFEKTFSEQKFQLYFKDLMSYTRTHPQIRDYNYTDSSLDTLSKEYNDLHRVVHTKDLSGIQSNTALENIAFNEKQFMEISKKINRISGACIHLLHAFHKNVSFTATERSIFVGLIPRNKRAVFWAW